MKVPHLPLLAAGLLAAITASAQPIEIPTVFVGNPRNGNDPATGNFYGGVSYEYYIGTYEVTNSQYTAFLNAVAATDPHELYNENMDTNRHAGIKRRGSSGSYTYSVKVGLGDRPVNYVSFWDAARFCNWLTTGDTETGVYNLNGTTVPNNSRTTRDDTAWNNGGVAVASENEWYKAAYYQSATDGGDTDGYWLYPTKSNRIDSTEANFGGFVGTVTDVGSYAEDASYYGTFDQGGNVWEWNDTLVRDNTRGQRGASFNNGESLMQSTKRDQDLGPISETFNIGFRVSSLNPITPMQIVPPSLSGFTYDPSTNRAGLELKGTPNTAYRLVEADNLDFTSPDQNPIPLNGASATVGTLNLDDQTLVTDDDGNASVTNVSLGATPKPATFLRAETP